MTPGTATQPEVLHVVGASKYGGVYEVLFHLCAMAEEHGLRPAILTSDPTAIEQCQARSIQVVEFAGIERPIRPWKDLYEGVRLAQLLRRRRPALIHTHVTKGGLVGRFAARLSGLNVPVVHTHHGLPFHERSSPLFREFAVRVERIAGHWCDRIVLMNDGDAEANEKHRLVPAAKVARVANGIRDPARDLDRSESRDRILEAEGLDPRAWYLGNVCRLSAQKNLKQFLDCIAAMADVEGRPVHGILVGEGPDLQELRRYARSLDLVDRVHMLGFRSDRLRLLRAFDVFLTTSLYEGMSISLLEAMALEKAIVATAVRGNRDCIEDGEQGLLVPAHHPDATARACAKLITDGALRASVARGARDRFIREFTERALMQNTWNRVYAPLLKGSGAEVEDS